MNPKPQRSSNLILCYTLIFIGVLCLLGALSAALILKNGIIERVREPERIDFMIGGFEIESVDREIEFKESAIRVTKDMPNFEEFRKKRAEVGKLPNNKVEIDENRKVDVNEKPSTVGEGKAEKIKRLEDEKQRLVAKKNELIDRQRANAMKPRSWSEWAEDYNIRIFTAGVLPLGIFSLFLASFVFGGRLPARNPLSLTDFERRCVLFVAFAMVFAAFGFFLFVWISSLIY